MIQRFFRPPIVFAMILLGCAGIAGFIMATPWNRRDTPKDLAQFQVENGPQCGADLIIEVDDFQPLYERAVALGIEYPATFARVVDHLYDENRLPDCYLTKGQARRQGWGRGRSVAQALPNHSIGGDRFGNREGLLPAAYTGAYVEADLDYDQGSRGAVRLVFVQGRTDEGLIWVTTDHYESFSKIYCGRRVCP